ncbi:MAG: DUF2298 domain-containing protein [Candidatus Dojkabacteria bacterium]|nr:MAG: DUF2298 domain-containing protein [Candidatus Dojkabacteria bacterium]
MTDIGAFILWYLASILLGFIGLPLSNFLFPKWKDRGYIFAKAIGLFIIAMPLWLLVSLRIIEFSVVSVWIAFFIGITLSFFALRKQNFKINKMMLFQEFYFLTVLAIWAYIRSFNSQIQGTEKFMNLAFMNSIDQSGFFPPSDPWYSGGTINYYYLGHYMQVFIGKLVGITTGYTYSLALVTIIAQLSVSVFSIIYRLCGFVKEPLAARIAFLGSLWVSFGGNMHYPFMYIQSLINGTEFKYFFPDPTRIIPFAIDEFPAYSIALGDLHGHYIVLPYFILAVALFVQSRTIALGSKKKLIFNAIASLFIVSLYGINSWDAITVIFMFSLLHLYQAFEAGKKIKKSIYEFLLAQIVLILPGIILMLPYILNFQPAVGGLGFVPFDRRSPIGPWLLMWGFFLIPTILFLLSVIRKKIAVKTANIAPILLFVCASCLIFGVEVLYFRDIFVQSNFNYFRTNTVFKFYYHAWILWGIAASWFVFALINKSLYRPVIKKAILFGFVVLVSSSVVYIQKAVNDFYPLNNPGIVALDGTKYLETNHLPDYLAISWLRDNLSGQPVVLEAVGEAYTYSARISTHTGFPTVMGWPTHQWQWRGNANLAFSRSDDVRTIYTTDSEEVLRTLLAKYEVEYILVGGEERLKYTELNTSLFSRLFKLVYNENSTAIYKVD